MRRRRLRLRWLMRVVPSSNRSASTCNKVPDQRDHCEYQQQVNESDRHVEGNKAQDPRDEQDDR